MSTWVRPVTVAADMAVKKATWRLAACSAAAKGRASIIPPTMFSRRKTPSSIAGAEVQRRGGTRVRIGTRSGAALRQRATEVGGPEASSIGSFTGRIFDQGCGNVSSSRAGRVASRRLELLSAQPRICQLCYIGRHRIHSSMRAPSNDHHSPASSRTPLRRRCH